MLDSAEKLDIWAILDGLADYRPRRQGWTWRQLAEADDSAFDYRQISRELERSIPLAAASYFGGIDPQPDCVISSEIASGHFEDDLRRMRMAAWHGADHIMVIRTLGQSHFDGLIEGTPEGVGGVPITRKQIRATRKALDLIEDEVGRPINLHSYVSGLAGPEIAVMFAEEGVNGAHQDFQYNILYRNINMLRSIVDSAEAKRLLAHAGMLQIDGAHNANSTAIEAWKVMPELLVQHALNTAFSRAVGLPNELIALSTVPPTAPPLPKLTIDLPYALAVRFLFRDCRFRAQQNTRYSSTNLQESTILHVLDTLVSRLTSADIQSTIAPDEARNIPWHYHSVQAVVGAKQALLGLDGISDLIQIQSDHTKPLVRDIIVRAILMLEDMLAIGGYFSAVEAGYFVDSGLYPERQHDGIRRKRTGGVGAYTVFRREPNYSAPVCGHFGNNLIPPGDKPCAAIGGCTLCNDEKVPYIDELDENDRVEKRLLAQQNTAGNVLPEAEFHGDGTVLVSMFIPLPEELSDAAALALAAKMNLDNPEIIDKLVLHPAEGVHYEVKGVLRTGVRLEDLARRESVREPDAGELRSFVMTHKLRVIGASVGDDEHSVGLHEIIDIKHGGLEKFGFDCLNLGTSVHPEKLLDAAIEAGACAILASFIVSHRDVHKINMQKLHDLAIEKGVRNKLILIAGGPHVDGRLAHECGWDAGFGRGTRGIDVASFLVKRLASTL